MRRHSGWIWGGRITAVVVLAGLSVYLASVGLDKADKLASVLSLLVAMAALIAPYLLPPSDEGRAEPKTVQQVANTVVSGHLTQVQDANGVRVKGPVPGRAAAGPPARRRTCARRPDWSVRQRCVGWREPEPG